ncbi:MAG: hypothetical protein ACR2N9_01235, partial [Acidimicrobiia bacterium]
MGPFERIRTSGFARLALLVMVVSIGVAACSSDSDSIVAAVDGDELDYAESEEALDQLAPEGEGAYKTVVQD